VSAFAADPQLGNLLATVEARYNTRRRSKSFFKNNIRARRTASRGGGTAPVAQAGQNAMDYTSPRVSVHLRRQVSLPVYAGDNRAQRMKLKETDDMRAPLAFLLGKLHFEREFAFAGESGGRKLARHGRTETDDLPYRAVEFVVAQDGRIEEVKVTATIRRCWISTSTGRRWIRRSAPGCSNLSCRRGRS